VVRLLDEPIAAALGIFGDRPDALKPAKAGIPKAVAVFNLGGGSCDACFMVRRIAHVLQPCCMHHSLPNAAAELTATLAEAQEVGEGVFEVRARAGMRAHLCRLRLP